MLRAPMRPPPPPILNWLPLILPLAFLAMWIGVCTALDLKAGHRLLLQSFPAVDDSLEVSFHFASGRVRGVRFNNALFVGIGPRGLHLAPNGLFRSPFFRAIPCVPWRALARVGPSQFEVRALDLSFSIDGEAGRALEQRLQAVEIGQPR